MFSLEHYEYVDGELAPISESLEDLLIAEEGDQEGFDLSGDVLDELIAKYVEEVEPAPTTETGSIDTNLNHLL